MKIVKPESSIKNPHAYAARSIRVGRKFPQSKKTLNAYINDAIDFHMIPEVSLYYSENCYGVADAANILAGRYVDGSWSYSQSLIFARNDGVSKAALDRAIIQWRKTLGETEYIKNDIQEGLEVPTW